MADKTFVGSGKKARNYDIINVSIDIDKAEKYFTEYKGRRYLRVCVSGRKSVGKYGETHSVTIDEFKPDPSKRGQQKDAVVEEDVSSAEDTNGIPW